MSELKLIAALILMLGLQSAHVPRRYAQRAEDLAPLIRAALVVEMSDLDPLLVGAMITKESGQRPEVFGKAGEVGYSQVKPDGMAKLLCRDLDIHKPADNIRCGVRILTFARKRCGGEPSRWLGVYKGWRTCGSTGYSRRVLGIMERARPVIASLP